MPGGITSVSNARIDSTGPSAGTSRSDPLGGDSPDRATVLARLARQDPWGALREASLEPNGVLRRQLHLAVLRSWAAIAPFDAAQQALTLNPRDRVAAMAAIWEGAARDPASATEVAALVCAQDPDHADEYGRKLITTLAEKGVFKLLTDFALAGTTDHRADWLNAVFYQWAERNPGEAVHAFEQLEQAGGKSAAFPGLVFGWAQANPGELATYAAALPPGENRSLALQMALGEWLQTDPSGAIGWMTQHDPAPELDQGAATLATLPDLAQGQPIQALGWAQSIVEPTLRESTLALLVRQWMNRDPALARQIVAQATGLLPADQQVLRASLDLSSETGPTP